MRIFVDSQSNALFKNSPLEQAYSLRGGLCEGGKDDVVIVPYPFDQAYLDYWAGLGFDLPKIVVVNNNNGRDGSLTISELILRNPGIISQIKRLAKKDENARLEFFCIEDSERKLSECLEIPAYCNFDFSSKFAKKQEFRRLCLECGIPVVEGKICSNIKEASIIIDDLRRRGFSSLIKSEYGTGGLACGGCVLIRPEDDIEACFAKIKFLGPEFLVEKVIESALEVSVHWEISENGQATFIGMQDQLSKNFGYAGVTIPSSASEVQTSCIKNRLFKLLIPAMQKHRAIGYFCCDVIIAPEEHWMDFNPRKGAALYVRRMTGRLKERFFPNKPVFVWHEHCNLGMGTTFSTVQKALGKMLDPVNDPERLVVITNSGVMPHGYLDITALSVQSREDALNHFRKAVSMIK